MPDTGPATPPRAVVRAGAGRTPAPLTPADRAARVAHDLQTPVAIILGLCSRIESAGVDAQQRKDLERVRMQASEISLAAAALSEPVEKLRAGADLVDASELVREVAGELGVIARERGVVLTVEGRRGHLVRDEGRRLRAAVSNLATNAMRQVHGAGRVRISVRTHGRSVTIEVADDGPGIPAAERRAVIRPYVQGRGARGSSGLGLSIVSDAAAALGGSLRIGDASEGGASFWLTVPLARTAVHRGKRSSRGRRATRLRSA